jgi:2-(1,2-epoxy-1,2-dihydrophenyl)acetyl-CoA isomerase
MSERHDHRLDVAGPVATITLERPAAYNAVTRKLLRSLLITLQDVAADPAVRAVVVTGAGKGFCAGQALDDPDTMRLDPDTARFDLQADLYNAVVDGFNPVIHLLLTMEKPIVAAVNGVAAGAGFGVALACDFRIVAQTAAFTTAFAKIGLVPDSGVSLLLPRIIGYARALELCMLSGKIDAAAAQALGLVTELVPFEDVVSRAQAFAAQLAAGPKALGLIKRELVRNALGDIVGALAYEAEVQSVAGDTSDAREGITAFGEKRKPVFAGR